MNERRMKKRKKEDIGSLLEAAKVPTELTLGVFLSRGYSSTFAGMMRLPRNLAFFFFVEIKKTRGLRRIAWSP